MHGCPSHCYHDQRLYKTRLYVIIHNINTSREQVSHYIWLWLTCTVLSQSFPTISLQPKAQIQSNECTYFRSHQKLSFRGQVKGMYLTYRTHTLINLFINFIHVAVHVACSLSLGLCPCCILHTLYIAFKPNFTILKALLLVLFVSMQATSTASFLHMWFTCCCEN